MRTYTTPTLTLLVEGFDITDQTVYVTLRQGDICITKTNKDISMSLDSEGTIIEVLYSQCETARFASKRSAEIEVNWVTSDGYRFATEIKNVPIERNLLEVKK